MLRTVYRRTNAVIKTGGGRSGPGVALEFAAVVRSPGTMRASGVAQAFGAVVRSRINETPHVILATSFARAGDSSRLYLRRPSFTGLSSSTRESGD